MATERSKRYTKDSAVDDYLLNQISKWIICDRLGLLARDLGIGQAEFSRIQAVNSAPLERVFQVLHSWLRKEIPTLEDFVTKLNEWWQSGYLDPGIWDRLQHLMDLSLLDNVPPPVSVLYPQQVLPPTPEMLQVDYRRLTEIYGCVDEEMIQILRRNIQHSLVSGPKGANQHLSSTLPLARQFTGRSQSLPPADDASSSLAPAHSREPTSFSSPHLPVSAGFSLKNEEFTSLQRRTRISLERKWRNSMAHDWISPDKAIKFPLHKFYVGLRWIEMLREVMGNAKQEMNNIFDILQFADEDPKNILIEAEPGMGKTCSLALLALDVAAKMKQHVEDGKQGKTKSPQFDLVFFVQLRYVNKDSSLAEAIVRQHDKLDSADIAFIDSILKGQTNHRVLLLMDGYDEYTPGTNRDIDEAIESTVGNCFILLTSRPGYLSKSIRDKMDGVLMIEGFSKKSIEQCGTLYLNGEEKCNEMLQKVKDSGIDELLHIPIILLMVCVVYNEENVLPKSKTELVRTIVRLMMDRTTLKTFGCKSMELKNLEQRLLMLGEFSWRALQKSIQQLLLQKEELEKKLPDVMKLGLLYETGINEAMVNERPTYVSFQHKLIQEYMAAVYVEHSLRDPRHVKKMLKELFPTWEQVEKHREVVILTCGMMPDPTNLIDHVYELWVEFYKREMRDKFKQSKYTSFIPFYPKTRKNIFEALYDESRVKLKGQPLCNHHMNFIDDDGVPKIFTPSKLFWFYDVNQSIRVLEDNVTEANGCNDPGEAVLWIGSVSEKVANSLILASQQISQKQPIAHLEIENAKFPEGDSNGRSLLMSKNAHIIYFNGCQLPVSFLIGIFEQLTEMRSLNILVIERTHLGSIQELCLQNLKHLTHLGLPYTSMSEELCKNVCEQLKHLPNLVLLDLSGNDLSQCGGHLCEGLKAHQRCPPLEKLALAYCKLPAAVCASLLAIVSQMDHLVSLYLAGNNIEGCLSQLLAETQEQLPNLEVLSLSETGLSESDLIHLKNLIKNHKVPQLSQVELGANDLGSVEEALAEFLEACLAHHQKLLTLLFFGNRLTRSFRVRWENRAKGSKVKISFKS